MHDAVTKKVVEKLYAPFLVRPVDIQQPKEEITRELIRIKKQLAILVQYCKHSTQESTSISSPPDQL